jgi:hypothetical protein
MEEGIKAEQCDIIGKGRKSEKLEVKTGLRVMKRFYSVKRLRKSGKVGNCNMF